jgi:hypothetical protein
MQVSMKENGFEGTEGVVYSQVHVHVLFYNIKHVDILVYIFLIVN